MPSYQERSEINRRLADQAYFDAKLKRVEPQKKDVRIGGMDGQTGRYQVFHADGGFSNNGIRAFDGTPPSDRFVRGQQNPNSNAIALGYRDYVKTEFLNRIEEEEITTQIIFLFQKENKLYVGGDRDEPELIYEAEEGESITQARITKTGEGINDYKAMFLIDKDADSVIYLNTYLNAEVFTVNYTPTSQGTFGVPSLSFIAADGSFVGRGSRINNIEPPEPPELTTAEEAYAVVRATRADLEQEFIDATGTASYQVFEDFFPSIGAGDIYAASVEISSSEAGIVYGTAFRIQIYDIRDGSLWGSTITEYFPLSFVPATPPAQGVSLFVRPEDDALGELQVDNYPSESRVLTVYYTKSDSISTSEFDSIEAFDSESAIFAKGEVIFAKGVVNKTIEIPPDSINNFIGDSVYIISDDTRNEDGTGVVAVNKYNISTDPIESEEDINIEYIGIPEDLKDYIVNYSVFF